MIIVIRFTDNDFWSTYEAVGKVILEALRQEEALRKEDSGMPVSDMTKDQIAYLVNGLLGPMYLMYQFWTRGDDDPVSDSERVGKYLAIKSGDIYLNEEGEDFLIIEDTLTNGEVLVIDTDLDHPGNTPVYVI